MSIPVLLPKLGNSVESSIIAAWLKQPGDPVTEGEVLCTVETDKTTMEVVSPASGVLLSQLAQPGDDVPVQTVIAHIGTPGSAADAVAPGVSPRARATAETRGVSLDGVTGSGPNGRIIERDVPAATGTRTTPVATPVAKAMLASGDYTAPTHGSGPGGIVTKADVLAASAPPIAINDDGVVVPLSPTRKRIAGRMRDSLSQTAQLSMTASADARALQSYRARLKHSDDTTGLRDITLNDLVLCAVARTLPRFPELNATFIDAALRQYTRAHLAFAVDTPRGLLVPVIRDAHTLSLRALAEQTRTLSAACREGRIAAADLSGGTFTVSNLGGFGIEHFTPILNPPQVAILGVGNINLKAVAGDGDGEVRHIPHLGLSLTIDHQVVDGAPAARFLQALTRALSAFDLTLAG
jgi:pyruvate dehydrogenase E2 component (dihydrolipoamide acetyltransferase)